MTQYVRVREKATGKLKPGPMTKAMAHALRDKYEIISEQPEETQEQTEVETPNAPAAVIAPSEAAKVADVSEEGVELANARKRYEELFGEKPHGRMQLKSLLKFIEEKEQESKPVEDAKA